MTARLARGATFMKRIAPTNGGGAMTCTLKIGGAAHHMRLSLNRAAHLELILLFVELHSANAAEMIRDVLLIDTSWQPLDAPPCIHGKW